MNLDCQTCRDTQKEARGCIKEAPAPILTIDGEDIYRCPLKLITKQSIEYVRHYNFFRDGFLPNAGGILDQSAKFIEVVEVIEQAIKEIERAEERKVRK